MTDINQTLKLPNHIFSVFQAMKQFNIPIWLVGGCLRDLLLNKTPSDWDFATPLPPDEIKVRLKQQGLTVLETGIAHGTLTFLMDKRAYEVTTFRKEGPYKDHRHPDWVHFTPNLTEDLSRRDFTINAMAYAPEIGLWDPFLGKQDIENQQIRCVGDPQLRFQEDALRILRGVRFAAQTGFQLEPITAQAIADHAALLKNISKERIREEFNKILLAQHLSLAFNNLEKLMLWSYIIPDIIPTIGFLQHSDHHYLDVYHHTLVTLQNTPPILLLRLAALFHDIGKPTTFTMDETGKGHFYGHPEVGMEIAKQSMKRLRYSKSLQQKVVFLVQHHMLHLSDTNDKTLKRFLGQLPEPKEEYLENLLILQEADLRASADPEDSLIEHQRFKDRCYRLLSSQTPLTIKDLAINGQDLIQLGIPPKERGSLLKTILELVLDYPEMNQAETLLQYIKNHSITKGPSV